MMLNAQQQALENPAFNVHWEFYTEPVEDKEASLAAGRRIMKDEEFVKVMTKGQRDTDSAVHHVVRMLRKKDPPLFSYLEPHYLSWKAGQDTSTINGTPLKHQAWISPAECLNMAGLGIKSVEDLAAMTDAQVQKERGSHPLRERAKATLAVMNNSGAVVEQVAALTSQNEQMKAYQESQNILMDELKAQIAMLVAERRG